MGVDIGAGVMHRMNMQLAKHRGESLVFLLTQILAREDQQSITGDQLFYSRELIVRKRCTQVQTLDFSP